MKFLTLGIIPLVVLHISSISATKPGQNVKMMALTMMGLREALCWKVVRVFWHWLNSFWPSLCKTGTVLHFFGPYFFLSDGRHNIRNWNIRSAFFQQWVYASNIQFWGLWKGSLVFDIAKLSYPSKRLRPRPLPKKGTMPLWTDNFSKRCFPKVVQGEKSYKLTDKE